MSKIIREKIFQAFNWTIRAVIENFRKIVAQGFTVIQLSPLQQHKEKDNPTWFLGYQVTNFKIGNRLGNKEDLKELCDLARKYNIKIIVDCVFNHVANNGGGDQQLVPSVEVEEEIRNRKDFFHEAKAVENYEDRYQCTQWGINLPDLNTSNHELQNMMIEYLKDLLSQGVEGFRFDAMRHIELPDDAWCGSDFWDRILKHIENKEKLFMYGEVIYADTKLVDRYCKYINVGVNNNSGSDKRKLVQWTFSHDDDLTFNLSKPKPKDIIINEWEYLLKSNRESHMLFYPCAGESVWADDRMREINLKY